MKINEVLELTKSMTTAAIAKERLTIGEKRMRDILKEVGCSYQSGKGWTYTGDQPELLEKSIYDFVKPSKRKAKAVSHASIETAATIEVQLDAIDRLLLQNDLDTRQRVYRGFYWDSDIVKVIDGVKHGNKSDLLNEIVRSVLKQKGWIE